MTSAQAASFNSDPLIFGSDGIIDGVTASTNAEDVARDSVYMYVVGNNDSNNFRIEKRLLTTGVLDANFDTDGVIDGATASNSARAIAIDANYMYIVGNDDSFNWRIEKRSLTTGALDANFDGDGVVTGDNASYIARDVAIDGNFMYIAGYNDKNNFRIEKRSLTTGALCTAAVCGTAFDTDGIVNGSASSSGLTTISIDGSSMYVAGNSNKNNLLRIEKRSLTTGALDTNFDGDGIVTGAATSNLTLSIAIDSTHMYVVGKDSSSNWRIEKRSLTTGALDTNFDGDGVVDGAASSEIARSVTLDGTSMYVVGYNDSFHWRIEKRSLTTGALDTNFDGDGVVDGAATTFMANAIAIDSTHMYVVGYDNYNNWRIEKRFLDTGLLFTAV